MGPKGPAKRLEGRGGGHPTVGVFMEHLLCMWDRTPEPGGKAGETLALASSLVGSQQVSRPPVCVAHICEMGIILAWLILWEIGNKKTQALR